MKTHNLHLMAYLLSKQTSVQIKLKYTKDNINTSTMPAYTQQC